MSFPPCLHCHEHHVQPGLSADSLTARAQLALPRCLAAAGDAEEPLLATLEEIEVSLISDEAIAAVHGEFMNDPTPTDVITFHHGEILISVETAARCALEHGHSVEREALLYVIHGLLHLNGHDDLDDASRALMHTEQERILAEVWPLD